MDFVELLKQWTRWEPNVCRFGCGVFRDTFFIRLFPGDWVSISSKASKDFWSDRTSVAKLQAFLVERLNQYYSQWSISRDENGYLVTVGQEFTCHHSKLVVALLSVYLDGLRDSGGTLRLRKEVSHGG